RLRSNVSRLDVRSGVGRRIDILSYQGIDRAAGGNVIDLGAAAEHAVAEAKRTKAAGAIAQSQFNAARDNGPRLTHTGKSRRKLRLEGLRQDTCAGYHSKA